MYANEDKEVRKLCRGKSCCPELRWVSGGLASIKDDHGGRVLLTIDEIEILHEEVVKKRNEMTKKIMEYPSAAANPPVTA